MCCRFSSDSDVRPPNFVQLQVLWRFEGIWELKIKVVDCAWRGDASGLFSTWWGVLRGNRLDRSQRTGQRFGSDQGLFIIIMREQDESSS